MDKSKNSENRDCDVSAFEERAKKIARRLVRDSEEQPSASKQSSAPVLTKQSNDKPVPLAFSSEKKEQTVGNSKVENMEPRSLIKEADLDQEGLRDLGTKIDELAETLTDKSDISDSGTQAQLDSQISEIYLLLEKAEDRFARIEAVEDKLISVMEAVQKSETNITKNVMQKVGNQATQAALTVVREEVSTPSETPFAKDEVEEIVSAKIREQDSRYNEMRSNMDDVYSNVNRLVERLDVVELSQLVPPETKEYNPSGDQSSSSQSGSKEAEPKRNFASQGGSLFDRPVEVKSPAYSSPAPEKGRDTGKEEKNSMQQEEVRVQPPVSSEENKAPASKPSKPVTIETAEKKSVEETVMNTPQIEMATTSTGDENMANEVVSEEASYSIHAQAVTPAENTSAEYDAEKYQRDVAREAEPVLSASAPVATYDEPAVNQVPHQSSIQQQPAIEEPCGYADEPAPGQTMNRQQETPPVAPAYQSADSSVHLQAMPDIVMSQSPISQGNVEPNNMAPNNFQPEMREEAPQIPGYGMGATQPTAPEEVVPSNYAPMSQQAEPTMQPAQEQVETPRAGRSVNEFISAARASLRNQTASDATPDQTVSLNEEGSNDYISSAQRANIAASVRGYVPEPMESEESLVQRNADRLKRQRELEKYRKKARKGAGSILPVTIIAGALTAGSLLTINALEADNYQTLAQLVGKDTTVVAILDTELDAGRMAQASGTNAARPAQKIAQAKTKTETAKVSGSPSNNVSSDQMAEFVQPEPLNFGNLNAPETTASVGKEQPVKKVKQKNTVSLMQNMPPARIGPLSLRHAAASGKPVAQFEIANRFQSGKGVSINRRKAFGWMEKSAKGGFVPAQYRIGTFYERGIGTSKSLDQARNWYRKAAKSGNVKAMHNLGVIYAGQKNPDYSIAADWFMNAAIRGLKDSQFNLAILYENGLGVDKNSVEAYKWYQRAANSGDKSAKKLAKQLARKISSVNLIRARREVRKWKKLPLDPKVNLKPGQSVDWRAETQS